MKAIGIAVALLFVGCSSGASQSGREVVCNPSWGSRRCADDTRYQLACTRRAEAIDACDALGPMLSLPRPMLTCREDLQCPGGRAVCIAIACDDGGVRVPFDAGR